jgi:pSer/pThr/pTyr-binding forkhead associated (FHA) protein
MSAVVLLVLRLLMVAGLYGFFIVIVLTLRKSMLQQSVSIASRNTPPITLQLHRDGVATRQHHHKKSDLIIGRGPECDCILDDEAVSGQHARLSYHHSQWWLEDLGSKNGTSLNEQPVSVPTVIVTDDEIVCGNTHMTVAILMRHTSLAYQARDNQVESQK